MSLTKRWQLGYGWAGVWTLTGVVWTPAVGCAQAPITSADPPQQGITQSSENAGGADEKPTLVLARPSAFHPAWTELIEQARTLAASPYAEADRALPDALADALANLDYDGHRDIRCLPEDFLWHGSDAPFRVQFRHPGWLFQDAVQLGTVDPVTLQHAALPFDRQRFTYGPIARKTLDPQALPRGLGYAGISLHQVGYKKNDDGQDVETFNEFLSIQGASYFRAIGFGQHWGSSARGIAVNTGLNQPEEFPRWTKLWIQKSLPGDERLILYGLLDGPSVSGAYYFLITPGDTLTVDIQAKLFFRQKIDKLGLAPMTGMFLFGEDTPARFGDYRPEVHDADGLLMQHADGRLDWRPLRNPPRLAVSRFKMTDPKGFGLMQRDRRFDHYQDLETEMQIRPSLWVTPREGFGEGWVELLEISSDDEGIDNIGAYWVPADESWNRPGGELSMSYRLDFTQQPRPTPAPGNTPGNQGDRMALDGLAARSASGNQGSRMNESALASGGLIRIASTRAMVGSGGEDENAKSLVRTAATGGPDGRATGRFLIDTAPDTALPNGTIVRADVTVGRGQLVGEPVIQYNKFTHSYRLFFDVRADGQEPVEMRATLRGDAGQALSETWLYRWDLP